MTDPDPIALGAPSLAYAELVTVAKWVIVEAARRRSEVLPGLLEHLQDNVVVVVGGTSRAAYGWFQCGAWLHNERRIDEVFLDASFAKEGDLAEGIATTLLHEGAHVYNSLNGINDTSNRGRYHSRRFAETALQLGLSVAKDPHFGHRTVGLQPVAREEFADLLAQLQDALTIVRRPPRVGATTSVTSILGLASGPDDDLISRRKYTFASCTCRTARGDQVTFRMAYGSWRNDVAITCSACGSRFTPRVSTTTGQVQGVQPANES